MSLKYRICCEILQGLKQIIISSMSIVWYWCNVIHLICLIMSHFKMSIIKLFYNLFHQRFPIWKVLNSKTWFFFFLANMLFLLCFTALTVQAACNALQLPFYWLRESFYGTAGLWRVLCRIGNIFACLNCPLDLLLLEDCDYVSSPIVFIAVTQLTDPLLMFNK